jgi:hypothetical protein
MAVTRQMDGTRRIEGAERKVEKKGVDDYLEE